MDVSHRSRHPNFFWDGLKQRWNILVVHCQAQNEGYEVGRGEWPVRVQRLLEYEMNPRNIPSPKQSICPIEYCTWLYAPTLLVLFLSIALGLYRVSETLVFHHYRMWKR
ncbi:hypothetical protein AG1IA_02819 [Rhizoctonia solani AG-1 IA]|uniref:Uncharacterized protein n=1 Tax=Thanatephorus cucumeris (strain AG1-IA) TaxID=983506 RepID=L8WYH7_THACA|nr:hypothetical protein AG1IA_02819 [Rhizoctonia solani AG-1 IA]